MKKLLIVLCLCGTVALGDTLFIPQTVKEVRSVSFSAGGDEDMFKVITVLCDMTDGTQHVYVISKFSAAGLFGVGRWAMPSGFKVIKMPHIKEAQWQETK